MLVVYGLTVMKAKKQMNERSVHLHSFLLSSCPRTKICYRFDTDKMVLRRRSLVKARGKCRFIHLFLQVEEVGDFGCDYTVGRAGEVVLLATSVEIGQGVVVSSFHQEVTCLGA